MRKVYLISLLAVFLIALWGYGYDKNVSKEDVSVVNSTNDSENLLQNPSFESPSHASAEKWKSEYTTYGVPSYYVTPTGAVDGVSAQQIYYRGRYKESTKEGKKFVEIFQLATNIHPGDRLKFSIYVGGSLVDTPAVIGIEGFNSSHGYVYLSEEDAYIEDISDELQLYEVIYTCPNNTDCVAVYLQCQEVVATSEIDITVDNARLVRLPPEYIETEENDLDDKAILVISSVFLTVPSVMIISETAIRIKGRMKKYKFSGQKNSEYQILVPIWGNIEYLENAEYLSQYGSHVTLCTTGNESLEFYESLKALADKYGFNIFIDEPKYRQGKKRRTVYDARTTSGSMRDTIIRNVLKKVSAPYVVTLDADSITDENISSLVGELEYRQMDIVSIRIVPSNREASLLTKLQTFEYEVAMDFRYLCPWLISGACHAAKTDVLEKIMDRHSLFFQGNDVEIGLLAKTMGYKVGHIPFIVRTAVPDDLISWTRQRLAWAGGEFRLYIVNFKFISKHPLFWFYGAIIAIGLFPLRWMALYVLTPSLFVILGFYVMLTLYTHWKNRNRWLFLMPLYTLFISVVMQPLGVIWYFYMARKDRNYGIIKI